MLAYEFLCVVIKRAIRKNTDVVSGDDHLFSLEVRPCFYLECAELVLYDNI